jgi:hypothetical protein
VNEQSKDALACDDEGLATLRLEHCPAEQRELSDCTQ